MEWASVTVVAIGLGVFWASVLYLIVALTGPLPRRETPRDQSMGEPGSTTYPTYPIGV